MSRLYKELIAASTQTRIEFMRSIRFNRAAELVNDGSFNVSAGAYQVGFNNPK